MEQQVFSAAWYLEDQGDPDTVLSIANSAFNALQRYYF